MARGGTPWLGTAFAALGGRLSALRLKSSGAARRPSRRLLHAEAKRSEKKKRERKVERRQDTRELERERLERKVAAEAAAPAVSSAPPPAPPQSLDAAEQRISGSQDKIHAAALALKALKQEARDSGQYSQEKGFKAFPKVQDAMQQLIAAKVTFDEARLESALLKLGDATGRLRHLADYDWRFGAGMEQNLRCCGYMLNNCSKFEAMEPAIAIVRVVEDNGLLQLLDPQATAWMQVQV